jgi:hypothetical protein
MTLSSVWTRYTRLRLITLPTLLSAIASRLTALRFASARCGLLTQRILTSKSRVMLGTQSNEVTGLARRLILSVRL